MTEEQRIDGEASGDATPAHRADPPAAPARKPFTHGFASVRDIITFLGGLAIIANEVFISDTAEASIVAVGVVMIGLPVAFGADERKRKGGDDG